LEFLVGLNESEGALGFNNQAGKKKKSKKKKKKNI
jgi:hypothetical protein